MASIQDSIENCSICQNSRNKNFHMVPQNYNHIFGYIGPASKNNLNFLLNSKQNITSDKKHNKHLKKSTSRHSYYHSKNLDLKNSQKWIQPGMFLYNVNSYKEDCTKLRYDESDADFEDLKYPYVRSTTHKSKSKPKGGNKCKQIVSSVSHDSDNTYGKNSAVYCLSKDSIAQNKSKKKVHKTDSEDMHPLKMSKKKNCGKIKNAMKNKLPIIDSDYSVDSTRKINSGKRNIRNTSTSSMKMKNLKTTLNNMFGSIESLKNSKQRRHYVSRAMDSEDIDPRIIKTCVNTQMKKPAAAFTNSDFSISSNDYKKKKKKVAARKKTSDSSTDLNARSKLRQGCFSSIESTKYLRKGKRKSTAADLEDDLSNKYPVLKMYCKKTNKGKSTSIKKKRKRIIPKCYVCTDLPDAY